MLKANFKEKKMGNGTYANINQEKVYITVLTLEKVGFTTRITIRDKKNHFIIMVKVPIYQAHKNL